MSVNIKESVGENEAVNNPDDVKIVKQRFIELGFDFFPNNESVSSGLLIAIRLFQSIISGSNTVSNIDGRIDVNQATHKFLESNLAPKWQLMPLQGKGFTNYEATDMMDKHDYGTDWMSETIKEAGEHYHDNYLSNNERAALLTINDVSLNFGKNTEDHKGHETGLACDIRLPNKDGSSGGIARLSTNKRYDRNSMRAQLIALHEQPLFRRAFLNDNKLIHEGLCSWRNGHSNHAHFEINPPEINA